MCKICSLLNEEIERYEYTYMYVCVPMYVNKADKDLIEFESKIALYDAVHP